MKNLPVRVALCLALGLPLRVAGQLTPPDQAAPEPVGELPARPSFWRRFIFTGGTSIVLPLEDFKQNLTPAFSAATGADFVLNERLFVGFTFSYNRHSYASSALYPGIRLESNTELLNLFVNGRLALGPVSNRLNPYVFAGPGVSFVSRPAIRQAGGELLVTSVSEAKAMGNVGAGVDFKINPMLIVYVETAYNTSFSGSKVQFLPVLLGFRTYPADFFRKK